MKKFMLLASVIVTSVIMFTGCSSVSVDGGEEVVFVKQPWIFGSGGIVDEPLNEGQEWKVFTTKAIKYNVKPMQATESFDDVITKDNNPVDFNSYLELEIIKGTTPKLHKQYGTKWYSTVVRESFRTLIRNYARNYSMFELTTDPNVTIKMANNIEDSLRFYFKKIDLTVKVNRVTIGKVSPPKDVIDETIKTAAQVQRKNTEDARAAAELNRMKAEQNKAIADRAYMDRFGMTTHEYLQLRALEIEKEKIEMVKNKENVNVIFGSGTSPVPMFNIK